jgi:hypothetical protein
VLLHAPPAGRQLQAHAAPIRLLGVDQIAGRCPATLATTPGIRLSFFSTRAAQEAQVIPPITRSTLCDKYRV